MQWWLLTATTHHSCSLIFLNVASDVDLSCFCDKQRSNPLWRWALFSQFAQSRTSSCFQIDTGAAWKPRVLTGRGTSIDQGESQERAWSCIWARGCKNWPTRLPLASVYSVWAAEVMSVQRHEGVRRWKPHPHDTDKPVGLSTHKSTEAHRCQAHIV